MYQSMRSVHGTDIAETIMSIYPPGDGNEIVTTRDLGEFQAATRAEMAELRTDLPPRWPRSAPRWRRCKVDLLRTLGTWLFASQAGVVAAVALVVSLMNR